MSRTPYQSRRPSGSSDAILGMNNGLKTGRDLHRRQPGLSLTTLNALSVPGHVATLSADYVNNFRLGREKGWLAQLGLAARQQQQYQYVQEHQTAQAQSWLMGQRNLSGLARPQAQLLQQQQLGKRKR